MMDHFLSEVKFSYVLQAVFEDEVSLANRSKEVRYRDVTAAVKTANLQNPLKNDLHPVGNSEFGWSVWIDSIDDDDPEIRNEYKVQDTQSFLPCDKNTFIQKILSIAGHLAHKCG